MRLSGLNSEILRFIIENGFQPGDQLPTIQAISRTMDVSVSKMREALEVARALGALEIKPGRGTRVADYTFAPAVTLSALYAIGLDRENFEHLRLMRNAIEIQFWEQAVCNLTADDITALRGLIAAAFQQLEQQPIQVPVREHRQLHMTIFYKLDNPFVHGMLEAFWEAYEAFGLHLYYDISYHRTVWDYHARIIDAVAGGDIEASRCLLVEHMNLLDTRPRPEPTASPGLTLDQRALFFE